MFRFGKIEEGLERATHTFTLDLLLGSAQQLEDDTSPQTRNGSSEKYGKEFTVRAVNERKQDFMAMPPHKRAAFLQSYYNRYKATPYRDSGFEFALADLISETLPQSQRGEGQRKAFSDILKELDPHREDRLQIVADVNNLQDRIRAMRNVMSVREGVSNQVERVMAGTEYYSPDERRPVFVADLPKRPMDTGFGKSSRILLNDRQIEDAFVSLIKRLKQ